MPYMFSNGHLSDRPKDFLNMCCSTKFFKWSLDNKPKSTSSSSSTFNLLLRHKSYHPLQIMLLKLTFTLVLTKLFVLSHADSILSHENVTEYELIHFNLDEFYSFGIIEFDYNNTHYKVQLFKNDHISPIINHQTDENISIIHHRKADDLWYVMH